MSSEELKNGLLVTVGKPPTGPRLRIRFYYGDGQNAIMYKEIPDKWNSLYEGSTRKYANACMSQICTQGYVTMPSKSMHPGHEDVSLSIPWHSIKQMFVSLVDDE